MKVKTKYIINKKYIFLLSSQYVFSYIYLDI